MKKQNYIKAVFIGVSHFGDRKIYNFNLMVDLTGHPHGSTVSLSTLKECGIKRTEIKFRRK